jgi:predicted acetyltransferase
MEQLPSKTIIEIAVDPEMNQAGPIAMLETDELSVLKTRLRENGQPVLVLWPLETRELDERYILEDDEEEL